MSRIPLGKYYADGLNWNKVLTSDFFLSVMKVRLDGSMQGYLKVSFLLQSLYHPYPF